MSKLIVVCARCGEQLEYTGMGNVSIVTIESWSKTKTTAERRYICPQCTEELRKWFEFDENEDIPMGG